MACPYVSGIVGLMRCYDNSLDPDSVEDCLENSAQNIDALNPGFEGLMGAGLVDVFGIVNCLQVPPIADFDVDFSIYCPGETINLNNLTIGPAVDTYNWSFPSGTPTSATSENPSVLYSSAGTYTITLTASNPFGSHTINHDVVVGFPSATLSGSTTTVAGTTVSLQVDYTGSLPYNLIYSDGTSNYTLNNIDENPFFFNITPEVNTTYNLVTVDNGICTTNLNGSAEINVLFVAEGEICSYTSIYGTADNNNITTKAFYDIDNEIIYRGNANADLCAIDASNGNMIWSKNFPELSQKVHGVVKTINNEFMMVSSDAWGSQADWYVYKADANGNLLWAKKYASAGRQLSPKLVASSGDTYFICGWFNTTGSSSDDVGILKIDGDGNILNSMAVHIGGDDQMGEAIGDDNGGLIITGEVEHDRTVFLLHYSANLNLISVQEYAPSLDYYSSGNFAITPTNDGGYAIAVWRNGGGETNLHTTLLKLDANKDVQWARSLFPTVNPTVSAQPYNITQDPSGGIHISGRAFINTGFQSTFFSKYTQNGTYIGTKAPQDPISLGLATSTHGSFITTNPNTPDLPLLIGYDMAESNFGGYDFLITRTSNNYSASACMFMDVNFTAQNETWSRLSSSTSTSTPAFSPINLSSITEDYTLNRTTPCIDCSGSDCALSCSVSASNTSICVGETVVFAPSCSGLSTYLWQIDNETIFSSDPTTSYTFNESGNHTITLYVNDDICTIAEDIIISVGSASASAGSDQSICVGSSANLNASGGSSYVWSPIIGLSNPLIANPVATPSETTTYTVNISDLTSGCSFSDEITVFVNPLPVLPPVTIDTSFCTISDPVSLTLNDLTPISDYTYSWSPTSGLSCSDCASPIANVISSTNYTLTITNALGCENTQTYTISIGTTGLPDASFTPDLADEYCATTGPIPLIPATPGGVFQGEAIFGSTWIPRFVTTLNEPIEISYTVTVNGCTATYVQTVTVIADPDANFTPLMPTYWNTDPAITLIPNETGGTFSSTCGLSGDVFNPASMPLETLCNITYDLNNAACYAAITQYLTVYPCIVPSGLNIINSSAANTLLTWDAVANAESYILQYRPIGTSTWQTSIASSNTHPLTGLDFCTDYEIQIATACGDNWSDFSSLITFTSGGCDLNVQLKVWLEGAYVTSINSMTNTLQNNGFIPLNQPYSTEPWYYTGTESVASVTNLPNYTTDWVLIELRNENDPTILIAQKVGFLLQDGSVVGIEAASTGIVFADVSPGNYYIVVRHRNHLAAMSSAPVLVPNDGAPYDFTSAATQAYGTNQLKQMPNGQYALYTGDINADGIISVADFNLYLDQTANINVYQEADLNLNGQITVTDFNDYLPNASTIGISVIRY